MGRRIKVTVGEVEVYGELNEAETADLIWKGLPIESQISTWGDEIISPFQSRRNWKIRPGRLWSWEIWGIGRPVMHSVFSSVQRQTVEGMKSGQPAR